MPARSRRTTSVSMKDVAKHAGVSQTTVSFVINSVPDTNIPQETQDRVLASVQELGYRPNALARGLRSQTTHTIGIISDEIATTPYAGEVIQGAQDVAWSHEKLILLINTGKDKRMKKAAVNALLERQVDGIIYATMYHREVSPPDILWEVPAVLVDCFVADGSLPSVVPDEFGGGYVATQRIIQAGHTRIGFINSEVYIPASVGREQGYRQALIDNNLPYDPTLVVTQPGHAVGGYAGAMSLLKRPDRPTAIFCYNDHTAMGVYQAAQDLGFSIPNDLAVVGYDNYVVIAGWMRPPLTTMELPHYAMGQWAVEQLMRMVNSPDSAEHAQPIQHKLTCPLIERASV